MHRLHTMYHRQVLVYLSVLSSLNFIATECFLSLSFFLFTQPFHTCSNFCVFILFAFAVVNIDQKHWSFWIGAYVFALIHMMRYVFVCTVHMLDSFVLNVRFSRSFFCFCICIVLYTLHFQLSIEFEKTNVSSSCVCACRVDYLATFHFSLSFFLYLTDVLWALL